MTALKVQNKIFPFACKNISCNKLYPLEDFIQIAILWGFIYFTNEEYNLIGLTCPNCDFTTLKKYRADSEEFSIKLLENNAPDSDFENNKINVEFKNFVPFSKRILYRVFFQQGDFVPRHINIHLNQFDIDIPLEAELFPEQFDGRYPQAESRDRNNFTIPENIDLLGHNYPKFVKDELPYSFSEEYLSHLCDIENNQDIKAIPRIVSSYNVYHYSDVWLRSVPNTKLFGDFKEKIYTAFKGAFEFQNVSSFYVEILGSNEIAEYKRVMHSFLGRLKGTENSEFFRKLANFFRVYNMARNTKRYEIMFKNKILLNFKIHDIEDVINVPFQYLFYAYHRKPVYDHVESDYEISHKTENKVQSPPKERPSNEHERQCVRIAKLFWEINDTLHPGLLVDTVEMIPYTKKKNGVMYLKDTIIKWIRPHWRKPYIGRPIHPKVWPISLPKDLL